MSNVNISTSLDNVMTNVQHLPTSSVPLTPEQLQAIVLNLSAKVEQHSTVISQLLALQKENALLKSQNEELMSRIKEMEKTISNQKSQLQLVSGSGKSPAVSGSSVPSGSVPAAQNGVKTPQVSYAAKAAAAARPSPLKKRVSAARPFKSPAAQGPQGFEYVYLGRSRKIDRSEVRSRLRRAGVDTGRVLDICFPASGVLGALVHTQYVQDFIKIMTKAQAEVIKDFDPLDPVHLADPKYKSLSEASRAQEIFSLVHKRAINTLSFVRPVSVAAVGRSFVEKGWIDEYDLQCALRSARRRLAEVSPKKATFMFRGVPSSSEESGDSSASEAEDMDL